MKKYLLQVITLLLLGLFVYLSFAVLMPNAKIDANPSKTEFSVQRAFRHVKQISRHPHYVGAAYHSEVRNYIVGQLQDMGLEVYTQNGYVLNDYGVLSNPENIVTVLKGSHPRPGNDLLLLAHYDSAVHSSYGAADDGAGVAAILESVRALLAQDFDHKNDIVICFTDAEEIGLLGAELFVQQYPDIADIGLVLNFEARGTGGPSNAILETNHGNAHLVKAFAKAHPRFPNATSLMYEIYKTMPNDTDATVFREEKDIPSFFFAFIGEYYNYHTAKDIPENLDINSLAHQGTYLMALIPYFGNSDLHDFQTTANQVYFNFPILNLVHYGYTWILPLLISAWIGFIVLLIFGLKKKIVHGRDVGRGFLAFILCLVCCGALGYFGWAFIRNVYPQYAEIQQGFPYNGHAYIVAFILLCIALVFLVYHWVKPSKNSLGLMIAPLVLWLLINTGLALYFKGASFFIIPVLFLEMAGGLMVWKKRPSLWGLLLCGIPAIFMFSPLILFVPVALGMKVLFGSLVLLVLVLGLLLPIIDRLSIKKWIALLAFLGGVFFLVKAHLHADFSKEHPKPNSLVYVLDKTHQQAEWLTYDQTLDDWTKQFITKEKRAATRHQIVGSKYGSGFTFADGAPVKPIPAAEVQVEKKVTKKGRLKYFIQIIPQRTMNRLVLFSKQADHFSNFQVNGILVDNLTDRHSKIRASKESASQRLLTYFPVNRDTLHLSFEIPQDYPCTITLYGASNNLLHNPWLKVPPRDSTMMPRPFVLNDAIVVKQIIEL